MIFMCTSVQEAPLFAPPLLSMLYICIYIYMYMHIISCTILLLAFYFTVCYAFQALFLFVSLVFRWSCLFVCLLLHAFALLIFLLFFLVSFRFYFRFSVVFFFRAESLLVCLFVRGQPVGQCYNYNATDDSRLAITIPARCSVSPSHCIFNPIAHSP